MGVKKAKSREERKIRESRIPIEENLEKRQLSELKHLSN